MKWINNVEDKIVASVALLALSLLVLVSNYIDRDHTRNVRTSIKALYEDRFMAETYILKMTHNIYKIREEWNVTEPNRNDADVRIGNLISEIREVSNAYGRTTLTTNEELRFAEFLKIVDKLESAPVQNRELKTHHTDKALVLLSELSAIQSEESKLIMIKAQSAYFSGKASSQFAFAVAIVILFVLQALVFSSNTKNDQTAPDLI